METIKSQTKLGDFEDFEEITDYMNKIIDDLWRSEHRIALIQLNLNRRLKND